MRSDTIICEYCKNEVLIYFSSKYNGKRGKCKSCNTDFPLE
jgi:hypothetical protein